VIAQGAKALTLGEETFRYDPRALHDQHGGATDDRTGRRGANGTALPRPTKAVDVSRLDAELLDATVRLVRLIDRRGEYRSLAPLVVREIVYRLLTGAQGSRMRNLATFGGHAHRMVRAVGSYARTSTSHCGSRASRGNSA
jgi:hypothetical protein